MATPKIPNSAQKRKKPSVSRCDFDNLRCTFCARYLSVPPIFISEGTNTCGRCDRVGIRNRVYEEIAKDKLFPCIYDDCKEVIPFPGVKDHEDVCPHRDIHCPIQNCPQRYEMKTIRAHFDSFHVGQKSTNKLTISNTDLGNLTTPYKRVFLLSYKREPYIVFVSGNRKTNNDWFELCFEIGVFCIQKGAKTSIRYDAVLFSNDNGQKSRFSKEGQQMQPLEERFYAPEWTQSLNRTELRYPQRKININVALDVKIYDPKEKTKNKRLKISQCEERL